MSGTRTEGKVVRDDGRPRASVIVVGYWSRADLEDCLPGVCNQSLDDYEVIFVDNDSGDGSVEYVRRQFPGVRVVENDENRWYPGGNNDGMAVAEGEFLVVLNPDVEVEEDWLEQLLDPFEDPDVGLTTSRIALFDDRSRLNTCGNHVHYTGLTFCRGLNEPFERFPDRERVAAVSGAAFAMRKEVYEAIGGFDEEYEAYLEETDLSLRARLAGYDVVYVPESVVYHKYDLSVSAWKLEKLERNRYLLLLKHFRRSTLLRMLPGLLVTELLVWVYAALDGRDGIQSKVSAWRWLLSNRERIARKRREVQRLRQRSDVELLVRADQELQVDQLGVPARLRPVIGPPVELAYTPGYYLAMRE